MFAPSEPDRLGQLASPTGLEHEYASLLSAIPFTPAGLCVVEVAVIFILTTIYKVPVNEATAIALLDRAISVLSVIALGSIAYLLSSKTKAGPRQRVDVDGAAPA